jgi:hypothetical protein
MSSRKNSKRVKISDEDRSPPGDATRRIPGQWPKASGKSPPLR